MQVARLPILLAEQENGYLDVASILGPANALGKISRRACAFLDESLAWVLTEVALLRIYNMCMQQPASEAILRMVHKPNVRPFFGPMVSHFVKVLATAAFHRLRQNAADACRVAT